jgi:hypothetical protein
MKNHLALLLLVFIISACKAQQQSVATNSMPDWLDKKIKQFKIDNPNGKGQVEKFLYHEQTVYLVDFCVGCPDFMVYVYNENEEVICEFGGIAGISTCADFAEEAISKGICW